MDDYKLKLLEQEWAVMARACGNWRVWPDETREDDHDHPDWQAAARAILERNELRQLLVEKDNYIKQLEQKCSEKKE